jgi:mannose-6-phosphate isomerase-like protein (cupin superfamily)
MHIVDTDTVRPVPAGTSPDYDTRNPMTQLMHVIEQAQLAAEREQYVSKSMQYLVPFDHLDLYGPAGDRTQLDPRRQDDKTDFQKQNVAAFTTTDTFLTRGLASAGGWTGPILRFSYRAGPDSKLSAMTGMKLGDRIRLWARIGSSTVTEPLTVPYNERSGRYEIELWAYPGNDLRAQLDDKGQQAMDRGELVARPDLVHGSHDDFPREQLNDRDIIDIAPDSTMHPLRPLHIECAWADPQLKTWDSQGGANYQYEFNMMVRGWNAFERTGSSRSPHGGVGMLEYRNLLSNYGRFAGSGELGRTIEPWMFDAFGRKVEATTRREDFFSVDYMDLHLLDPFCAIGLHRHRDNQEIFFLLDGRAVMVVGDWAKLPNRERSFEVRSLHPGHFAMLKGGNLHGLLNPTDSEVSLLMFGGYD